MLVNYVSRVPDMPEDHNFKRPSTASYHQPHIVSKTSFKSAERAPPTQASDESRSEAHEAATVHESSPVRKKSRLSRLPRIKCKPLLISTFGTDNSRVPRSMAPVPNQDQPLHDCTARLQNCNASISSQNGRPCFFKRCSIEALEGLQSTFAF
jgi:hypothetical protein